MTDSDNEIFVMSLPYETRLAVTRWVFHHVVKHARDGGTYRYLIYDRLGFEPDAYGELLRDGMVINNSFDLAAQDEIIALAKEHKLDVLKPVLDLCDEPGCFLAAAAIWAEGRRRRYACGEHFSLRDAESPKTVAQDAVLPWDIDDE